ncbi:peptidoglycan/LPS O-acetylase OafA/YrhL [Pseudarthrobacter oxydans]|uniref:Peptidoglycan/LPS O-acetylase OafA/YrhL n=2 Tax=Pseudarthrobacter TaxID=1742993 RepID=A0ABT9RXU9_9MICC|nr:MULTISPECIES: acyltransferase family protein [Micrococcaceae]MDP9890071.1 peptidoglycan/LPS O-acetylase OafA/YrhL [Pseudarthrobacter enclensis]MDP9988821.1 peptidoglycan/LPS O-acetylase OafA/YrhL [Arthrobacter oryzae]MDR7166109.1 peptidoglycan/LPS O-acetylase OafA/YrhL [Pseudarthrobacter oxydans]NSX36509.1 acyltransferase [Pseudarthrobacter oxydans]
MAEPQSGTRFRPEVQGLRAVALLIVVLYHVWFGRVSGGVDVFLLVSAFLLTLSFAERVRSGEPFRLRRYWARIFSRLLPPAAIVLLATVAAGAAFFPQVRWAELIEHAWASLFYVQNWAMAFGAVDYQAAQAATASPFQHFWSMSIQGQVFILWPLLLLGVHAAARRTGLSFRALAAVLFGVIFALSLAFSIHQTATNQSFAYFDTRTRLWEFALGSLLALVLPYLRPGKPARIVLGWAGLAAILFCGAVIQVDNQFPGWAALIPTLGAAMVITAGNTGHRFGADRLLTAAPVRKLGGISYALYLWHWSVLITYLVLTQEAGVTAAAGAFIIGASGILAWLTTRLVERPLRSWGWMHRRKRRSAALTIALAIGVAIPLGAWETRIGLTERQLRVQAEQLNLNPGAAVLEPGHTGQDLPDAPLIPAETALDDEWGNAGPSCTPGYAPGHPALESCQQIEPDTEATKTVVVIGDSHAQQLMPALVPTAQEHNWRMISLLKNACRYGAQSPERDTECNERNDAARDYVLDLAPDAVITHGTLSYEDEPREGLVPAYEQGIRPFLDAGIEVAAVRDNPRFPFHMFACVGLHGQDSHQCNPARDEVLLEVNPLEELATREPLLHSVDLTNSICTDTTCPAVMGNVYVYRDHDHLNKTYVETMTPAVKRTLLAATGWGG